MLPDTFTIIHIVDPYCSDRLHGRGGLFGYSKLKDSRFIFFVFAKILLHQKKWYIYHLCSTAVCVCVFSSRPFWTSSLLDVPAGVTQKEGHTGFFIHLPSAVRALTFIARRIQPFLSLVDREVDFLCTNELIVLHPLGIVVRSPNSKHDRC